MSGKINSSPAFPAPDVPGHMSPAYIIGWQTFFGGPHRRRKETSPCNATWSATAGTCLKYPGPAMPVSPVSLVVNYEEGAEYSTLDGDSHHETNGEVPSPVPPETATSTNESFFEYGSRVGVWRLLDMFRRYGVSSTFYCCALALERNSRWPGRLPPTAMRYAATATAGRNTT